MRHKYKAKPVIYDNVHFASTGEMLRYRELKMLYQKKRITQLRLQPRFPIKINGMHVCTYVADFQYVENGQVIVEDFKGVKTQMYRLKKKLMKAVYGIDILETYAK